MIDTHCHLLPGLDDGPRRLEASLALARQLVAAGVSVVVCTPHFSRRFPVDHADARQAMRALRTTLQAAGVPLELRVAAEVGPATAAEAPLGVLGERRLGAERLLVELEPDTPAGTVPLIVERLAGARLRPVFAHPERCRAVRTQPGVLDAARRDGALVQVVAPSFDRPSGDTARAAWGLLEAGRVDILASDAHHASPGGLALARTVELVRRRFGSGALSELIEDGPARALRVVPHVRRAADRRPQGLAGGREA